MIFMRKNEHMGGFIYRVCSCDSDFKYDSRFIIEDDCCKKCGCFYFLTLLDRDDYGDIGRQPDEYGGKCSTNDPFKSHRDGLD